jgi:acetyl esterase/lipase
VIAALYPIGMLLMQLVLALAIGWGVGLGTAFALGWVIGAPALLIGFVAGAACVWGTLHWFKKRDGKLFAYYLMHDYAYSARYRGANPPELEARMAEFTQSIAKALQEDVDEVLVVGHSSGAHLAVSILSDLIRSGLVPQSGPKLAFLSLGQVVPMVSFLRDANRLRGDLAYLSTRDELTWIDVTAPGDGCAFALCDPVSVSGVASDDKIWPIVFSAQFTKSLSPARWKELRWKFFRLHFQYLCAFDAPLDYDYFQITSGPLTLETRYENRPPSASRIDWAVSKYTSTS